MQRFAVSMFVMMAACGAGGIAASHAAAASSTVAKPPVAPAPARAAAKPAREDGSPAPPKARRDAFESKQFAAPVARLDSAEVAYASVDYAGVVRILSIPGTLRPRESLLLGWSLYRLGRMPDAVTAFERGLATAPEHIDLINGHAFALYRTGRAKESEAEFRRILATNPDREESIRGLAVVLYTSQRFEEGLPIFDKLLRDHPGDKEVEHQLITSVDGMLSAWQQAGRTPADMVAAGWKLDADGNRRSALEIFRWVLTVDPFHPGARLGLGTLGPKFGLETEAQHALEELLRENPTDNQARAALAQLHLDAGRAREARQQVEALLIADPHDVRGLQLKRQLQANAGKP